jgi:hypothetical protein
MRAAEAERRVDRRWITGYSDVTWAEARALQGWSPSADSVAGMIAGGQRAARSAIMLAAKR